MNMNIRKVYSHEDVYYDSDCTVDISRSKNIGPRRANRGFERKICIDISSQLWSLLLLLL
jgi:hypothetical protein